MPAARRARGAAFLLCRMHWESTVKRCRRRGRGCATRDNGRRSRTQASMRSPGFRFTEEDYRSQDDQHFPRRLLSSSSSHHRRTRRTTGSHRPHSGVATNIGGKRHRGAPQHKYSKCDQNPFEVLHSFSFFSSCDFLPAHCCEIFYAWHIYSYGRRLSTNDRQTQHTAP
jgi:hypothetical protein